MLLLTTLIFWGLIGLGVLSPIQLVTSIYKNVKITGKYHFRSRYYLEKEFYQREIRRWSLVIAIFVIMFLMLIAASHRTGVKSYSDAAINSIINLI